MVFALSDMQLHSSAFGPHTAIPQKFTGEGEDVSPALSWTDVPTGTQGFAVVCHDPDAPLVQHGTYGFVHWVLYNLPASITELPEGADAGTSGSNDFGNQGYGGPMPPEGDGVHHYYFWVLALNKALDLPAGLSLPELLDNVEPYLLGMNRLIGIYER